MVKKGEMVIYKSPDGSTQVDVKLENDTLWMNQHQIAELFKTDRTSVLKHIKNILDCGELHEKGTCAKFAQVQKEGKRTIKRQTTLSLTEIKE
jgi:hypothetical protein